MAAVWGQQQWIKEAEQFGPSYNVINNNNTKNNNKNKNNKNNNTKNNNNQSIVLWAESGPLATWDNVI